MFSNELWQKSGVSTYSIDQSIRFNDDDSAYMQRTHGAGGNVDKWSLSFWLKRSTLGTEQYVFGSGANTSNTSDISFNTSDQLVFWSYISAYQTRLITTQVLRDTSAWYHVLVVYDSGNATSGNRAIIYINGSRVTAFGTETYPSQNQDGIVGSNVNIGFGRYISNGSNYFDGYLAEMHYVNGSALAPTDFGETTSDGIWKPIEYTGSYGTGGFYIKGEDSSDLGNDSSGNGNDLTTSGLASHDQMVGESPTNNFAVLNPLDNRGSGSLSQGNLRYAGASTNDNVTGTIGLNSGKWYWEVFIEDEDFAYIGIQKGGISATGYAKEAVTLVTGDTAGTIHENNANSGNDSVIANNNDVVGVAVDIDNKKIWWSKNGQWYRADQASTATINISEVEAGNQGFVFSLTSDTGFFVPYIGNYTHATTIINFGQEGTFANNKTAGNNSDGNGEGNFFSTVPNGFLAINTKNLGS